MAERAHRVSGGARGGQYGHHARAMDASLESPQPATGRPFHPPGSNCVANKLAEYPPVRGLVFGNYSECCPAVLELVTVIGHALARKHWRLMGARDEKEARSYWVSRCRVRLGVAVGRAFARCRLTRAKLVGIPRAVLDARPGRGAVAGQAAARTDDLNAFLAWQAHQSVAAA